MARFLFFGFLLLPFFSAAQVVDTARVRIEVDSLVQLNRKLVGQSKFEEALQVIEMADSIALVSFGEYHAYYANCLHNHGRTLSLNRISTQAESLFLKALEIREKVLGKEHPDYASTLNSLGINYNNKGEYDKAETLFLESLAIREKVLGKEHPDYAVSLNNLAVLYYDMGKYEKAEPLYIEAKAIREKVLGKEHPDYAWTLNNLANLYRQMGNNEKAEQFYLEAISIWEKVLGKEHPAYAASLNNLAVLYDGMGNFEKAEPLYLDAKAVWEKVLGKEHPDYATSLNNLANLYKQMGNYETAELLYLKAKAIWEKVLGKEHSVYATSLNNLAFLYNELGNYEKAEPLYIEANAIWKKVLGEEHPDYASSLHNLANLYLNIGNYEKAELLNFEAKAIREKVLGKEHPDYAKSLDNLAILYNKKGNNDMAEPLYLEAKAIREKVLGKGHPDYAIGLNNLANLYSDMGNYKLAEPLYLEAKAIQEKALGKNHPNYARILNNLAKVYETQKRFSESAHLLEESCAFEQLWLSKSATFLSERELAKYIVTFQENGDRLSAYLIARQKENEYVDVLPALIFDHTLFYKGFLLTTAARLNSPLTASSESAEIMNRLKGYRRRLATEYTKPFTERKNMAEFEEKANLAEKELSRTVAGYGEAIRQIKWQKVQASLKKDDAAIEFVHFRVNFPKQTDTEMYSALVTMPGGNVPQFVPLCEARQLDALIYKANGTRANYLLNLYASPRADGLLSLNQLLWSPIEKVLREQGVKTVYYSPTGLLHRLNLGAIAEGKSGVRLADSYHLVPMGSTRQLATDHSAQSPIQLSNVLIYGGVRYEMDSSAITKANADLVATAQDTTGGLFGFSHQTEGQRGENWDYLPGTEKEARYLDALLRRRGINTKLRLGYEATEESFKQIGQNGPSPSLLHIGTHGFFFPDPQDTSRRRAALNGDEPVFKISEYSMIRSGLKLAGSRYAWEKGHPLPGGHEDGILTAYEVSQMNLSNTQLVVLSACETGLGDIRGNEGVYGLQRAFRIAGAKNVLMSLWKVPDDATQKLMTRFYNNWLAEKKPLRESFEEAQKWLREQKGFENPYFWAGFVLVGEL